MSREIVVQEFLFDLAENTIHPTVWTGYGLYGRRVEPGTVVTPQQFFEILHPDDRVTLIDHLERVYNIRPGEVIGCKLRFLHAFGEYVEASISSRLEEADKNDAALIVRTTSRWLVPLPQTAVA